MFNTKMPLGLRPFYQEELDSYRSHYLNHNYTKAWEHLERAHVLGQQYPLEHTQVHWLMLRFGIKIKNRKEIIGQLPRLLVGGVKSFVGKIPVGNTGGANVPPLQPMEIKQDLREVLERFRV